MLTIYAYKFIMSSDFSPNDRQNMALALNLAARGKYDVAGNPMVGCVITKNERVIAQGYHQKFGAAHAEINALAQIHHKAIGAVVYLTLEPCAHFGKTPPCVEALIKSGVKKIIIAMVDPNPLVGGRGIQRLKNAGIEVKIGLLEAEARALNRGFIQRMKIGRPFVVCKIAMSLDGKTSMKSGQSKWITGAPARQDVQQLRADNQAILTGSGTILADNPALTVRLDGINATPLRAVIDGQNQITQRTLRIFSPEAPTLIFNPNNTPLLNTGKLDLANILTQLGKRGLNTVLLEAGPKLIGAMIERRLIDEFVIYCAPILMGNAANSWANIALEKMADTVQLEIKNIAMIGADIKIIARPNYVR